MSILERNLPIEKLIVGDIVSPEGKYITSAGYYFTPGTGFRVKRINTKSVSLAPLSTDGTFKEKGTVRINRLVTEYSCLSSREVAPRFARDNSRVPTLTS